jgi:DNA-binding transcriptional ArsR family regulator
MNKTMRYYELHAEVCKTFGHPKRLFIIDSLRKKELSVSELAEITEMDISNLSQHLNIMKEKGIVKPRREGTSIFYSLAHPNIIQAYDLISEVLTKTIQENQNILDAK